MKQPRVPEYREADGVKAYIKPLILFLKDFAMAAWTANNQRKNEIAALAGKGPNSIHGLYAFHIDESGHLICTYDTLNPPPLSINSEGHLIYMIGGDDGTDN